MPRAPNLLFCYGPGMNHASSSRRTQVATALATLYAMVAPVLTQADSISTDRPGNGNAASAVKPNVFQLETSGNLASDAALDGEQLTFPTGLRLGLIEGLEARLNSDVASIGDAFGTGSANASDVAIGLKIDALKQVRWVPELAVMAQWSVPTGARDVSSESLDYLALLLASWTLPAGFSILSNVGVDTRASASSDPSGDPSGDAVARLNYLLLAGYSFSLGAQKLTIFAEGFGRVSRRDDVPTVHQVDFGVAWLVTEDLQLDIFSQHGLVDDALDFQLATGFSYRWFVEQPSQSSSAAISAAPVSTIRL